MATTTNCKKFKGEIENYLINRHNNFDSKLNSVFSALNIKTWLCRTNITKQDGYHASHILFILIIMPMLKLKSIHSFCEKHWQTWSTSRKDTFYRFKQNAKYRWRSFMYKINIEIFKHLDADRIQQEERYFVIDDTNLAKTGRKIENVSYIFDRNLNRHIMGFCIITLGLFTPKGFYPLDFAYRFGKKRHAESPDETIGDPRSSSGQRSYEAKHCTKLEPALMMIKKAVKSGMVPGYVMFDSWYAWPAFINAIRRINDTIHVICRLKNSNVQYEHNGTKCKLSELYQKVKKNIKKDARTGLLLCRIKARLPGSENESVIVFSKGYCEPEDDTVKGKKKQKEEKWAAFLSTNTALHSSTIIKKYIMRWPIEVCFKECKQMPGLGKDQSNDFNAQVCAAATSFLRYNILNCLNEVENYPTLGKLFESIADESAVTTYSHRLWEFFYGLFHISFSKIFELFEIEEDFQSYINVVSESLTALAPFKGCET